MRVQNHENSSSPTLAVNVPFSFFLVYGENRIPGRECQTTSYQICCPYYLFVPPTRIVKHEKLETLEYTAADAFVR